MREKTGKEKTLNLFLRATWKELRDECGELSNIKDKSLRAFAETAGIARDLEGIEKSSIKKV